MNWEVGKYIGSILLGGERAKYGKHIVVTLLHRLIGTCDRVFEYTKIPRMIKFAELFPDVEILAMLSQELSWSHFIEILPLKSPEQVVLCKRCGCAAFACTGFASLLFFSW